MITRIKLINAWITSSHIVSYLSFCVCVWWQRIRSTLLEKCNYAMRYYQLQSAAVRCIPRSYSSYNFQLLALDLRTLSSSCPSPPPHPCHQQQPLFFSWFYELLIQCLSFCVWLTSLSIMSQGSSMLSQVAAFPYSFLWLNNIPYISLTTEN